MVCVQCTVYGVQYMVCVQSMVCVQYMVCTVFGVYGVYSIWCVYSVQYVWQENHQVTKYALFYGVYIRY